MTKGPIHKAMRKAEAAAREYDKKHPEPLSLFHKREQSGEIPFTPLPRPTHFGIGTAIQAAQAMAEWDNSDPFAFKRTLLHVRQGFLDPKDLIKEVSQRTTARRIAKAREVDNAKKATA